MMGMRRVIWVSVLSALLVMATDLGAEELATVNGQAITSEDMEKSLRQLPPQVQVHYAGKKGKTQLLERLIDQELVYQEAKRSGIPEEKEVLDRIEEAKRAIIIEAMFARIAREKVTQDGIKKYYEGHVKDFKRVNASHILVDREELANKIYKELKAGADFSKMAKEHSLDPSSRDQGGNLGFITKGQMVKPFEDKAFSLKENKISEPVESPFGFHIIKVLEIQPAKKFSEMTTQELGAVRNLMMQEELNRLRKTAKVKVHPERIQ